MLDNIFVLSYNEGINFNEGNNFREVSQAMRMRQLLYLKTVAEEKSITKASRKLFVSQQAISQAINNLENDLHTTLLSRSVHGVELTTDGQYVLDTALQILRLNDSLSEHFNNRNCAQISGSLRIMAIQTVIDYFLPTAQVAFIKKFPQVKLSIIPESSEMMIKSLVNHHVELGFGGFPYINNKSLIEKPPELIFTPFVNYKYCVTVSKNSSLAKCQTLSVKNILKYPITILEEQIEDSLEDYMPYRILAQYQKPNVIMASSKNFYTSLIRENIAISLATSIIFDNTAFDSPIDNEVVNIPIRDNIGGELCIIRHQDSLNDHFVNVFVEDFQKNIH